MPQIKLKNQALLSYSLEIDSIDYDGIEHYLSDMKNNENIEISLRKIVVAFYRDYNILDVFTGRNDIIKEVKYILNPVVRSLNTPTEFSNWIIPDKLLASRTLSENFVEYEKDLLAMIEADITVFVSLQTNDEEKKYNVEYRNHIRGKIMEMEMGVGIEEIEEKEGEDSIKFIRLEIDDGSVPETDILISLAYKLCEMILDGEKIMVHCYAGVGRTSLLNGVILYILYGLYYDEIIELLHRSYLSREKKNTKVNIPQTFVQECMLKNIID